MYIAVTFVKNVYSLFFYNVRTVEWIIRHHIVITTVKPFTNVAIWNGEIFVTRLENFITIMSNRSSACNL